MHMSEVTTLCQVLIDPDLKWGLNKYHSNSIRKDTIYPSIYWLIYMYIYKQVNASIDIIETVLSTYYTSITIRSV